VTVLSFLNFMSLPDPRAHSLLSAVLLKRQAAIAGDPHSNPSMSAMSDQERVALLKAAEEALQVPLPVVKTATGARSVAGAAMPSLRGSGLASGASETPSQLSDREQLDALRSRSRQAAAASALGPACAKGGLAIFSGESWLQLDEMVDSDEITFGTWIYVPSMPESFFPTSSESMKTIAANKFSGCATSSRGWAFFMHEWATSNRQLRLSWTDHASGCNEIYSGTALVPYDTWVLVGFSLSKAKNRASIVMNDQLVVDTQRGIGNYVRQGRMMQIQQAALADRVLSDSKKLLLGAHVLARPEEIAQAHGFIGFMGDVRIFRASPDGSTLVNLLSCSSQDVLSGSATTCGSQAAVSVMVQFQQGSESINSITGTRLQPHLTTRGTMGEGQPNPVPIVAFADKVLHPLLQKPPADSIVTLPGTTLDPEALRKTWPKEWLLRFSESDLANSQAEADAWASEVRAAMQFTWKGYRDKAWGHDEVMPASGRIKDWCKMAITMLDGLSTLWVMGLEEEFNDAVEYLERANLPTADKHGQHSLFEINIRAFAGLLSAYSLSGKQVFLDTAKRLGEKLLKAFDTPSGMPLSTIDIGTGEAGSHSWNQNAVLAEITTLQVEFRFITQVTGDRRWQGAADKAMDVVLKAAGNRGLVPIYLSSPKKQAVFFVGAKVSVGAMGDSYYEYLLKQWIQGGKKDARLKDAWKRAMKEMMDTMVVRTSSGLQFVAELEGTRQRNRMDHLACFVAGMLMLGSRTLPKEEVDPRWEPFAAELTYTCYQMYVRMPTGLSPEYVAFNLQAARGQEMSVPGDAPHNLLRPEAAEALWYMWYYTGDHKYRQWGHEMFLPFLRFCKAKYGFSAITDVRKKPPPKRDAQESFWLGETLKYFYLLFSPRSTLNLEEFVLNTEAQPLRIMES